MDQLAGIRKTLAPIRTGVARYDVAKILKSVLIKRDFLRYIKTTYPKMSYLIDVYMSFTWYQKSFGIDPNGITCQPARPDVADGEADSIGDCDDCSMDGSTFELSAYTCHAPLVSFLERLCRNGFETAMCRLCQQSAPGKNLNITFLDEALSKDLTRITEKYNADFPPQGVTVEPTKVILQPGSSDSLEVVTKVVLDDDKDYRHALAAYNARAAEPPDCKLF